LSAWLDRALDQEVSTRSSALLRIGLAVIVYTRFADAATFGPTTDWLGAGIMLAYWGATTATLFGWHAQLATAATALSMIAGVAYFGVALHQSEWSAHHHVYLLIAATACSALTPNGRSYSLDRWRALARSRAAGTAPPPERGRAGALYLMAVQLSAVYFWGAFNKTTLGWLSGDKFESQLLAFIFDSDPPAVPGWHAFVAGSSIATVALEYALAFGLWSRAARRWLVPIGIAFHVVIYMTLPVTVFSALSCLMYLAYFDPDDVHAVIDRLSGARSDA
jgi:hypothetical protein